MRKTWPFALALVAHLFGLAASPSAAAPPAADVRAGEQLATAATTAGAACASCHGQRGERMASFPRLAGFGAAYLQAQLDAFATGARKNQIMQPIAQALSPPQRAQVAAYFSSLPAPSGSADRTARGASDVGAWLATRGRWEVDVPACAQCHGPGGMGVGEAFPPLAGQSATYLADQLRAWQSGTRPPGPLGLMEKIARKLSAADIQAVSDYYADLAGATATPATGASSADPRRAVP